MAPETLGPRALGRATLERQFLLHRAELAPREALERLVGLQAQVPRDPYLGLWARLAAFRPESLSELLLERTAVRTVVMRGTIHLVTADDCLLLRPLVQPVLDAELVRHRDFAPLLADVELGPVLERARALLAERPHTGPQLRSALAEWFPGRDGAALAYACRCKLALVQVPPRGLWGRAAQVTTTTAEAWLGRPLVGRPSIDDVVVRYLAAFGPATVADVAAWCRLTGLREVVERLRPRLRTFRDASGRELFDLPEAPRPGPDVPAPTRFLPEYDNVLLSHADRSRIYTGGYRPPPHAGKGGFIGNVLVDGFFRATFTITRQADGATLLITPFDRLSRKDATALSEEGERLLHFVTEPEGARTLEIRFAENLQKLYET